MLLREQELNALGRRRRTYTQVRSPNILAAQPPASPPDRPAKLAAFLRQGECDNYHAVLDV